MAISSRSRQSGATLAVLVLLDVACIGAAFGIAVAATEPLPRFDRPIEQAVYYLPCLIIFVAVWLFTSLDEQLFGTWGDETLSDYSFHVTKAVAEALVVSTVVMALFTRPGVQLEFLLTFGLATLGSILAFRLATRLVVWAVRRQGLDSRRVLLIGLNDRTERVMNVMRTRRHLGYEVVGYVDPSPERGNTGLPSSVPRLGGIDDVSEVIGSHRVGEVYVTLPIRTYYSDIETISNACAARRIPLRLVAELFPLKVASNELMYVDDVALLSLSAVPEERIRLAMKRAIDFLASTLLLLVLFVPLFIVALLIKADSRGPIFFAQERVGQNRRRFSMLKFRSMVVDAEARRAGLDALNEADGPVFKIRNDPRITRVGRFIRKYSVDEFPQLINVWLGQMSLVGPRPPLASEVEKYSWDQRRRLSVKPGMTGLWQVSGRSNVGFEEWVALDLQYIDTWSVWSDFKILLKTFGAVVRGRGAA